MKLSPLSLAATLLALAPLARAEVTVKELPDRVRIEIGGKLFTELHYGDSAHVYYYPLIGPGGAKMTRAWPMEDVPGEEHDHPHHRSMWFSHGLVNGVDFWGEDASYKGKPKYPVGKIVLDHVIKTPIAPVRSEAKPGRLSVATKWIAPDGTVPVTGTESLVVYERKETDRLFDFQETLTAGDKDVTFGDTKEGTFAIRIAESMRLKGVKNAPGLGHILNSEGLRDDKVWGEHAKWVDMSGPVDGKTVGIAIFDHPDNPRHPTRWHARDYGLFAANPFCEHEMDKTKPEGAADFKLPAGKSVTFKYRVFMHEGEPDAATLEMFFNSFVNDVGGQRVPPAE